MNRLSIESLMTDYCIDKLGLRDVSILVQYSNLNGAYGMASGSWNKDGKLTGNLQVDINQNRDLYLTLETFAHELFHIKQYTDGTANFIGNNRFYAGGLENYEYSERAIEREARKYATQLVKNFLIKHKEQFSIKNKLNLLYFDIIKRRVGE